MKAFLVATTKRTMMNKKSKPPQEIQAAVVSEILTNLVSRMMACNTKTLD